MSLADFPNYPPAVQQEILNGPAMMPPDGTIPNLVDPPNHTKEAIAIAVICLFLGVSFGVMRLYSRLIVSRKLHLEDYLGILAFAPYAGLAWAYFRVLTIGGFFVHQWDIRLKDMFDIAYALIIFPICYSMLMLLTKTAILLEWNRIFVPKGQRNTFFWASGAMGMVNIALYVAAIAATALSCVPMEKLWHTWVDGRCINRRSLDICTASFNLAIDIFILVLPQNVIWKLHMSKTQKIGVSMVFSVGILACICAAGRVYSTATLDYLGDVTYGVSKTSIWAMAENTCVLIVFCMPAIPKAFSGVDVKRVMGILSSLSSWTRLRTLRSHRTSENKSYDNTWPANNDSNELKAFPIADGEHYTVETLTLEEANLVREHRTKIGGAHDLGSVDHSGILKTTEIGQRASYQPDNEYDPYLVAPHGYDPSNGGRGG